MEKELFEALEKAIDHLDYCGWGDAWERECATQEGGIQEQIMATFEKAKEKFCVE